MQVRHERRHLRHPRRLRVAIRQRLDPLGRRHLTGVEQQLQRGFHFNLHRRRRVVQEPHVRHVCLALHTGRRRQSVVCPAENQRREELLAVVVPRKRARLLHQRPDDVPVVDARAAAAHQTLHAQLVPAVKPDLDAVLKHPRLHRLPYQPRRHRVRVLPHPYRAPRRHRHRLGHVLGQPLGGQHLHHRLFLGDPLAAREIGRHTHVLRPPLIVQHRLEIATAPQQQVLFQPPFEHAVGRLHVAVLLRLADANRPRLHAQVAHHSLVFRVEEPAWRRHGIVHRRLVLALGQVVGRRRRVVRLRPLRHMAQSKQRRLHPAPQRQQRLRLAHRDPLPVRVRQHEMAQQVRQRLAEDRDAQFVAVREVSLARLARPVVLREKHFHIRTVLRFPDIDPPLQRANLTRLVAARIQRLQVLEQHVRLERRRQLQQCDDLRPIIGERVRPRAPVVLWLRLRRQLA